MDKVGRPRSCGESVLCGRRKAVGMRASGNIWLEIVEMSENYVLDVEADGVKCEGHGLLLLFFQGRDGEQKQHLSCLFIHV